MKRGLFCLFLLGCESQTSVIKSAKELSVTPDFVDLGTVAVGDTVTQDIKLTHLKGDSIQVVDIHLQNIDGSEFSTDESLTPTVDVNATEVLTVTYTPSEAGFHRALLSVSTDEEETPVHEVDLRGAAVLPIADISPGILDFGPVAVGDSTTQQFTLSNLGTVPLSLSALNFSNAAFSSAQGPAIVDPGGSLDIDLRFEATDSRRAVGTLSLDLGPVSAPEVLLRANDCEEGESALYDVDGDGVTACGGDCDDGNASVLPGAAETCDGVDSDCDGIVDDGTACSDDDADGYTEQEGDCDDSNAAVGPAATEDPGNGIDDDCDGITDLGAQDLDGDGYAGTSDCDDGDPTLHPGAVEKADAVDNDCDGIVDEGTPVYDDDGDGYNERAGDCNDADASVKPGAVETADHLDNDCDGTVDEGTAAYDDDGDGFTENGGDCDDTNAAVSPAAWETVGNNVDDDCDGTVK